MFHEWQTIFDRFEELYRIGFFIKRIGYCVVDIFLFLSGKVRFTLRMFIIWLIYSLFVRNIMRYDLYGFTNRIPIFIPGILAGCLQRYCPKQEKH